MNTSRDPLLAEWACLGALYHQPSHGFAVSKRLALNGDLGRVWHVTRPLTYRALDQLRQWGWIESIGEETGDAGPNRTLVTATHTGRSRLRSWIATPVAHVRDVRTELLLKVVLAHELHLDIEVMLQRQCDLLEAHARSLTADCRTDDNSTDDNSTDDNGSVGIVTRSVGLDAVVDDVVLAWRREMTLATHRFVSDLLRDRKLLPTDSSR